MSKNISIISSVVVILMAIIACNLQAPAQAPAEGVASAGTLTAQAVDALLATQLAALQTTITPTVTSIHETQTPIFLGTHTPTLTPTLTPTVLCDDKAEFVENVNIPDDSQVLPGEDFTQTWRIRNTGTCTWTPQYALVYDGGDRLGGAAEIPLTTYISPDATVDLAVLLTAPDENGSYEGQWKLRSADQKLFGIGENSDEPFLVKINVSQSAVDLNLGAPTWQDTFKNSSYWYLLETEYTKFTIKNDRMILRAKPGGGDEWGITTEPNLSDFYLEATFKTGETCSGLDRYGVLVRAPTENSGYVFGFSCDGRYRIYKWDGANYSGLQSWKQATQIKTGANQTNQLGFFAQGSTIKLYANGQLLQELTDSTYSEGRFGLFVCSVNTEELEVFVEDMAYWDLTE